MYRYLLLAFMLSGVIGFAAAQGPSDSGPVVINQSGLPPMPLKPGIATFHVEEKMDAEPVKGAPFCAMVTTEHTQNFADGNRIHTSDNSSLCRDSEGRTRREATFNLMGAAAQTDAPKLITIVDPVAGFRYTLDSENKIAHKMALGAELKASGTGTPVGKGGQLHLLRRPRQEPEMAEHPLPGHCEQLASGPAEPRPQ